MAKTIKSYFGERNNFNKLFSEKNGYSQVKELTNLMYTQGKSKQIKCLEVKGDILKPLVNQIEKAYQDIGTRHDILNKIFAQ